MTTTGHLPPFLGDTLEDELVDAQLAFAIPKSDLETARSLFASKWWDYRFVHPGRCYFLFADLYGKELEAWRDRYGVRLYVRLNGAGHPIYRDVMKGNVCTGEKALRPQAFVTGLWRAMCFCDAHGIPYDRYLKLCFEYGFEHQWQRMPNPVHLYGDRMVAWVLERWKREEADLLRLPTDPRFMADGYVGHPWQDDFQEWLLTAIAKRPIPRLPLEQYMIRERYIVPRLAAKHFGLDTVRSIVLRAQATARAV